MLLRPRAYSCYWAKVLLLRVMEVNQLIRYRVLAAMEQVRFPVTQVIAKVLDENKGVILGNGFPVYISDLFQMITVYDISGAAVEREEGWVNCRCH